MEKVKRIFVEKKPGFDVEAEGLKHEFTHLLGIEGLEGIRVVNRYDIEGMTDDEYRSARHTVFSEPPVDLVYDEKMPVAPDEKLFAYEYLPGQYDQRADSCEQCIQLITQRERPVIRTAKVIAVKGDVEDGDIERIKKHLVNPVDSRVASLEKPATLHLDLHIPEAVEVLEGFIGMDEVERAAFMSEYGLAMNPEDLEFIQGYFKNTEKRDPTITEVRVIDTYWSDHCRHTTFLSQIDSLEIGESAYLEKCRQAYGMYMDARKKLYKDKKQKPVCLMDIALMAMKEMREAGMLDDLEVSDEINACSIKVDAVIDGRTEKWLVMFKNETHNHPTEIEPFGGAATCLGGAIRDPLSGRSYVYQAMRVTGSGDPTVDIGKTLQGKLPQIKITREAAHGYSSYGNQIGLATGVVNEIYDEGFVAKRMEIGAVIAAAPAENVKRLGADPDDIVILVGGRTGRDGCGGATGSSKKHTEESLESCGAEVQKGNPPTERKLQRLFRNPEASKLIKKCNDFGAGGVSVAIGELASGLHIDLDAVPKKYEGLDGTELAISESQERMAVVVDPSNKDAFIRLAEEENLECAVVARITDNDRLRMSWNGNDIVDISRGFLDTNGITQHARAYVQPPSDETYFNTEHTRGLKELMKDLNICSQKGLVERFDSTIGAGSILMPYGGRHQLSPQEGMAAKLPVLEGDSQTATLMTFGYNPKISKWSTFHGACYAVLESVARITAMGGDYRKARLTLQEYFEKLGDSPERWGKPAGALLGAYYAQKMLGIPAIGGKDSMSGSFKDLDVPPTLVSFAVVPVDSGDVVSSEFKEAGSKVILVEIPVDSDYIPDFEKAGETYRKFNALANEGKVKAAMSVKHGGIAEAVAKMGLGNGIGFKDNGSMDKSGFYKPGYGCIVAEVEEPSGFRIIGETTSDGQICITDEIYPLNEIAQAFEGTLEEVFPTKAEKSVEKGIEIQGHVTKAPYIAKNRTAKPVVFIPVFPGTNCEYDTKRAFERAGAICETMVFRNLSSNDIHESVRRMAELVNKSNIVMIPGGFSAGDEPEGSGKFIATVFRNPGIAEAVTELIEVRDGLVLGICNGFQALIKLGLLPYGKIGPMEKDSPTLTFNTIGRHVSTMVRTKISSDMSPWLQLVNTGDIHTVPVSHGEGRFFADERHLKSLFNNGQVATQYVDEEGNPTYDIRFNPNGSVGAIEGITSPDGRIFGKMAHSERTGEGLLINVPGEKDQRIFDSGVKYFK